MQIRKKTRIVIASILKPVNDIRMFEKMGLTMAAFEDSEVHIIGYPGQSNSWHSQTKFHPHTPFKRLGLKRLMAPIRVFKTITQLKPQLLIVNTAELLIVAVLSKILFGSKIIYDIRENYALNIRYTEAFPKIFRPLLSAYVSLKQKLCSPFFDHFILAEQCYKDELSFVPDHKHTIIENKVLRPRPFVSRSHRTGSSIQLLFTGTISKTTGVFNAISIAKKLHSVDKKIQLKIIGYCALSEELEKINTQIKDLPFISLEGGDQLVSHARIIDAIQKADFGIISNEINPATQDKIPTKLYEYLGYQLPFLITGHAGWLSLCEPYSAAIGIESFTDPEQLLHQMNTQLYYTKMPVGIYWDEEESRFIEIIRKILSK